MCLPTDLSNATGDTPENSGGALAEMEVPETSQEPSAAPLPTSCRYQGHMPGMAFSFGSPYGSTTFKHFQDQRNKAMAKGHRESLNFLPSLPAAAPALLLSSPDRPSTRFNLDVGRAAHFTGFYQVSWGPGQLRP